MNVLTFRESLVKTLARVPPDAELVLEPTIIIPVTRNAAKIGEVRIAGNETGYFPVRQG
jgi:hypothetical protein